MSLCTNVLKLLVFQYWLYLVLLYGRYHKERGQKLNFSKMTNTMYRITDAVYKGIAFITALLSYWILNFCGKLTEVVNRYGPSSNLVWDRRIYLLSCVKFEIIRSIIPKIIERTNRQTDIVKTYFTQIHKLFATKKVWLFGYRHDNFHIVGLFRFILSLFVIKHSLRLFIKMIFKHLQSHVTNA